MYREIDYAARVQRGIALLDEKWPTWAKDIDLEKLDIESDRYCVTAQYAAHQGGVEFGTEDAFSVGQELLALNDRDYERHGFNTELALDHKAYPTLNGLWKAEIVKRRALDAPEASGR